MITKALRTLQCLVPAIRPLKFAAYNFGTKAFGWHMEEDFRLLTRIAPVELALDIGANWGQSILALQRTARPKRVVSFEPNPVLAARLLQKFSSDPGVGIQPIALADRPGTFKLYVPSYRGYLFDGLASLDYESAASWLDGDRIYGFKPEALTIVEHDVSVRVLDEFGLLPDVVKIDVQGMELAVIEGGQRTLAASKPVVIVETPPPAVVEALAKHRLFPYRFHGGKLMADDTTGLNTVFIHPDRLARLDIR